MPAFDYGVVINGKVRAAGRDHARKKVMAELAEKYGITGREPNVTVNVYADPKDPGAFRTTAGHEPGEDRYSQPGREPVTQAELSETRDFP